MQQETGTKRRLRRTWWFWVVIAFVVIVVLGGGAVLADWIVYYGEIHAGVTVNGVYLRGKTVDQATVTLQKLVESAGGPVTLTGGGKTWTVTPEDVGRVIDVQAAVTEAKAITHEGNFFEDVVARFDLYRHARDLSLHGTVDKAKLDALLTRIATELHVTPQNAWLKMENGAVKVMPEITGRDVDTAALARRARIALPDPAHRHGGHPPDRQDGRRPDRGQRRRPAAGAAHDERAHHAHQPRQEVDHLAAADRLVAGLPGRLLQRRPHHGALPRRGHHVELPEQPGPRSEHRTPSTPGSPAPTASPSRSSRRSSARRST